MVLIESVGIFFVIKKLKKQKYKNENKLNQITAIEITNTGLMKIFSLVEVSRYSLNNVQLQKSKIIVSNFIKLLGNVYSFCQKNVLQTENTIAEKANGTIVFFIFLDCKLL